MTLDALLHPFTLIYLIAFILNMVGPHFHARRKMMAFKAGADSTAGIYMFLMNAHAGAYGAGIAATGALIQALTPNSHLKKTIYPRLVLALVLSFAAIYLSYHRPSDILPIAMVIICRFGELQRKAQRIRLVYCLTCLPWIAYHFINGLYLPMAATTLLFLSLAASIMRHHKKQQLAISSGNADEEEE